MSGGPAGPAVAGARLGGSFRLEEDAMSRTDALTVPTATPAAKPLRDVRGFWRILLAVLAPLPMLAKAVYYLLIPADGDAGFTATVDAYAAHKGLVAGLRWADAVFVVLLLPAVFAVAWVARRGAPRLATAGALVAMLGCLAGFGLGGGVTPPQYLAAVRGVDPGTMHRLYDLVGKDPLFLIAMVLFLVGIVIGLGLLGAALWRSRVVAAWWGIALMVGGITHPFVPTHVGQGVGLVVAAVGFAGASVALLRTRDDDFDLPPVR
jgi:hypothetical protein